MTAKILAEDKGRVDLKYGIHPSEIARIHNQEVTEYLSRVTQLRVTNSPTNTSAANDRRQSIGFTEAGTCKQTMIDKHLEQHKDSHQREMSRQQLLSGAKMKNDVHFPVSTAPKNQTMLIHQKSSTNHSVDIERSKKHNLESKGIYSGLLKQTELPL
ncbi:hypothetical protein Aperf_G00000012693 [Anoplocephala perfoliata]